MNWKLARHCWVEIFAASIGTEEHETVLIGAVSRLAIWYI